MHVVNSSTRTCDTGNSGAVTHLSISSLSATIYNDDSDIPTKTADINLEGDVGRTRVIRGTGRCHGPRRARDVACLRVPAHVEPSPGDCISYKHLLLRAVFSSIWSSMHQSLTRKPELEVGVHVIVRMKAARDRDAFSLLSMTLSPPLVTERDDVRTVTPDARRILLETA